MELYLRRFMTLSNPSMKLVLDRVDVILNDEVENRFKDSEDSMHNKYNGIEELSDEVFISFHFIYI